MYIYIFFFKQKTAYEMRISDWSSDVCSSDLDAGKFSIGFLLSEWTDLVDAWQLDGWEAYRDVKRLGRKTRLSEAQRKTLWAVFDAVRVRLESDRKSVV